MLLNNFFKKSATLIILSSIATTSFFPLRKLNALDENSSSETVKTKFTKEKINLNLLQVNPYILGPGDILSIKVINAPEFDQNLQIINDGTILLPLVGPLFVEGLTITDAQDLIVKNLSIELISPQIQLNLVKQRPIKVSLVGEIARPGLYSLTSSEMTSIEGGPNLTISGVPTVVDAIQKAGGITKLANLKNITLKRKLPGNKNEYKSANLNLQLLLLEGDQIQNPFIFDGDIIIVDKASTFDQNTLKIAKANFSPKLIRLYIVGEVNKPGYIEVVSGTVLTQSIFMAGGPKNWRTNKKNIQIVRLRDDGSVYKKRFLLDLKKPLSPNSNPTLESGDIILVGSSFFAKGTDAIKQIGEPIGGLVSIFSLYKILGD